MRMMRAAAMVRITQTDTKSTDRKSLKYCCVHFAVPHHLFDFFIYLFFKKYHISVPVGIPTLQVLAELVLLSFTPKFIDFFGRFTGSPVHVHVI